MTTRNRWIAGGIALLLVFVGIGASVLRNDGDGPEPQDVAANPGGADLGSSSANSDGEDDPSTDTDTIVADSSGATSRSATTRTTSPRTTRPAVKDTPTPPKPGTPTKPSTGTPTKPGTDTPTKPDTGTPTKPGTDTPTKPDTGTPAKPDDGGLTEEERQYLEDTREIVESNDAALRAAAEGILDAIVGRDPAALTDQLAGDEGPQPEYIAELVARYPAIIDAKPASTVNIFSSGDATLYFTYVVVRWQDAGITSEHTISIPLRYVDGAWHLTSLDESAEGLTFVQAVQL